MIVPSAELRKKIMKNGNKTSGTHKFGEVWYDPLLAEFYVVVSKRKINKTIYIQWIGPDWSYSTPRIEVTLNCCDDDRFIRLMSSLERELL